MALQPLEMFGDTIILFGTRIADLPSLSHADDTGQLLGRWCDSIEATLLEEFQDGSEYLVLEMDHLLALRLHQEGFFDAQHFAESTRYPDAVQINVDVAFETEDGESLLVAFLIQERMPEAPEDAHHIVIYTIDADLTDDEELNTHLLFELVESVLVDPDSFEKRDDEE